MNSPGAWLAVSLTAGGREFINGRCMQLDLEDGADGRAQTLVGFSPQEAPLIQLGQKVMLRFEDKEMALVVSIEAVIVSRTDSPSTRTYGFRIGETSKPFRNLVNRRKAVRVSPLPDLPMSVRLLEVRGSKTADVVVHDISVSGISLLVAPDLEVGFFDKSVIRLMVQFQGLETAVEVRGFIRNRRIVGSALLYGMEFDEETSGFRRFQNQLSRYVARLQIKGLRHMHGL